MSLIKVRFENLSRISTGQINGTLINNAHPDGVEYTLDPALGHVEKAEAGEWGAIKELSKSKKDYYAAEQKREEIKRQLSDLDFSSYKIERAIAGDQRAIDEIKAVDIQKELLRAKL